MQAYRAVIKQVCRFMTLSKNSRFGIHNVNQLLQMNGWCLYVTFHGNKRFMYRIHKVDIAVFMPLNQSRMSICMRQAEPNMMDDCPGYLNQIAMQPDSGRNPQLWLTHGILNCVSAGSNFRHFAETLFRGAKKEPHQQTRTWVQGRTARRLAFFITNTKNIASGSLGPI
jgi:hypothetical protein